MITLYDFTLSGNCHRVRLLLSLLGKAYQIYPMDLRGGEHKRAPFTQLNPFCHVPVLTDGDHSLRDSNAILIYLAKAYGGDKWWPTDALVQGRIQEWLAVCSNEIAHGPAAARLVTVFGADDRDHQALIATSHSLLAIMDAHLAKNAFLAGDRVSIADVSAYPYIATAPEGGVSLSDYPNIKIWLVRLAQLPGFVAMPAAPGFDSAGV